MEFITPEDVVFRGCNMALDDAEPPPLAYLLCEPDWGGGGNVVLMGDIVVVAFRWVMLCVATLMMLLSEL